jgi:hypothetical protein
LHAICLGSLPFADNRQMIGTPRELGMLACIEYTVTGPQRSRA